MKLCVLAQFTFLLLCAVISDNQGDCLNAFLKKKGGRSDTREDHLKEPNPHKNQLFCKAVFDEKPLGQGVDLTFVHLRLGECRVDHASTVVRSHNNRDSFVQACGTQSHCVANQTLVHQVLLLDGPQNIESHVSCECVDSAQACTRRSNIRVFHKGTGNERTVDVGRCIGACKNGKKRCRPISSTIVSVPGPNGAQCVSRVDKCGCSRACHRVSFLVSYGILRFDRRTNTSKLVNQVIDVGRCSGECTRNKKTKCIFWADNPQWGLDSKVPQKVCVLRSPGQGPSNRCLPKSFTSRVLLTAEGPKIVSTIKQCKCN